VEELGAEGLRDGSAEIEGAIAPATIRMADAKQSARVDL
jgi:hypothetical protein